MIGRLCHPVNLPMYDWPEFRSATRELETALQSALLEALGLDPTNSAEWPADMGLHHRWEHPGLLLGQTCGYPLTHALSGKVHVVGAPHYRADGCSGPHYCSHLIVSKESAHETLSDLRGLRAVFNASDSQSGMNAFRHEVAQLADGAPFFSGVAQSGSHLQSMVSVADGQADIASIDAVCWSLALRELPDLTGKLRSIGHTIKAPGLPYITSAAWSPTDTDIICRTVQSVLSDAAISVSRERLLIDGFSVLSESDYEPLLKMERSAAEKGYPELL
ncbi:PhnD/SsuA/transferrin family substrate-binding protein [uncultured Roseibium sp.]|uniref:phosphate/phosphite/phosphonate ABC transporter substrate-binding protein n=1 Tax=uncultured Roseibium sp. TaxID=1936171 RepID=UPI002614C460|nr:PhnD/SsuA/transferrin family substrate-binding protein [uncultured Roseibium sp.]